MSKSFNYISSLTCQKTKTKFDALCIVYGSCENQEDVDFCSEAEFALKAAKVLPDCIVVIASTNLIGEIVSGWKSNDIRRKELIDRGKRGNFSFVKNIIFLAWNGEKIERIYAENVSGVEFSISGAEITSRGLEYLVEKNKVVQVAPAGHIFRHPSGTRNKLFIQTRELAVDEPELKYVAECIVHAVGKRLALVKIVLIDTMGIYPYVLEALRISNAKARVVSFHGYEGLESISVPDEKYHCVISASTTGGMARKLVEAGFKPENILTLIDSSSDRNEKVLIDLSIINNTYDRTITDSGESEIELVGENFSSKAKPPRAVTLNIFHTPIVLKDFLEHFGLVGVNPFNSLIGQGQTKAISLKVEHNLLISEKFTSWLTKEIEWVVPAGIDTILYVNDPSSKEISTQIFEHLKIKDHKPNTLKLVSYENDNLHGLRDAEGILVVSAICGDGSLLRQISRDLREFSQVDSPKHFFIPFALPQSQEAWARLRKFLVKNATKRNYGISNWICLPVGFDGDNNSWNLYNNLSQKMDLFDPNVDAVDLSVARKSVDLCSEIIRNSYLSLLPKHSGEKLKLTEGFVYFNGKFDEYIDAISESVVYLTISSVIQYAREIDNPIHQLKPSGYESVIISPETFLRFNDGILQASILRSARPSELDYSSSIESSRLMKEFLIKVFDRHTQQYGEAALEYALAIAVKKLRLNDNDLCELVNIALSKLSTQESPLLGALIYIKKTLNFSSLN